MSLVYYCFVEKREVSGWRPLLDENGRIFDLGFYFGRTLQYALIDWFDRLHGSRLGRGLPADVSPEIRDYHADLEREHDLTYTGWWTVAEFLEVPWDENIPGRNETFMEVASREVMEAKTMLGRDHPSARMIFVVHL